MKRISALAAAVAALSIAGCGGIGTAQKDLRTSVEAKKPTLDQCYGAALVRDQVAAGDMDLVLHVSEKTGQVEKVAITRSSVQDPELQQCVEQALVGIALEPKPKANLEVEYQLQFTPTS
jgi:hypothetical protein